MYLELQNAIDSKNVPSEPQMASWIKKALELSNSQKQNLEITIRIVSKEESQQLNNDYREKDKPTNVLSFPFEMPEGLPVEVTESENMNNILGDLAICEKIVIQEAKEQGKVLEHHWAHMIIHGTLHLLGYDHIEETDAEQMEKLEIEILRNFSIDSPY